MKQVLQKPVASPARVIFRMVLTGHEGLVLRTTDHGKTFREVLAAGVYRHHGGGLPLCLDARAGVDAFVLWPGVCPPIMSPGPVIAGR